MGLDNNRVALSMTGLSEYPAVCPFNPACRFPEYRGRDLDEANDVYGWVRETLHRLGLDAGRYGSSDWNPFKDIVEPGMTVFIKPNTVSHRNFGGGDVLAVIVHASILRPILDYVHIALKGEGRIIIGDSQVTEGLYDGALAASQIGDLLTWYRQQTPIPIECMDLRINRSVRTWLYGKWGRKRIEMDHRGYEFVDLGERSCFRDIDPRKLRIGIASYKNMFKHHSNGRHEYLFPNSLLQSDAIINIAKLKTHRRTAVTLAMKNFMGLPAWKDSLPHFRIGAPSEGGDQYIHPSTRKRIGTWLHDRIQSNPLVPVKFVCAVAKKLLWNSHRIVPFKDDVYEAMWYGNDTVWRTLIDLNRAALYADKRGKIQDQPQRKYFCLIDGIIGGENDGPLSPDPVPAGVLLAGLNPVAIECAAIALMGFAIDKIPLAQRAIETQDQFCPLFRGTRDDIEVITEGAALSLGELEQKDYFRFEPHANWKGHVERERMPVKPM